MKSQDNIFDPPAERYQPRFSQHPEKGGDSETEPMQNFNNLTLEEEKVPSTSRSQEVIRLIDIEKKPLKSFEMPKGIINFCNL